MIDEPVILKTGVLLLIESQEELNILADLTQTLELDSLHIDDDYVAYMEDVLIVIPLREIEVGHWTSQVKPRKFGSWYRKHKG